MREKEQQQVPDRLDVKVGFACNNRCRFCVQGDKRHHHPARKAEDLVSFITRHRQEYTALVLTGGEPCIYPELPALVSKARDLGYRSIQIQSNGRMFAYREYCESLVQAGATEFSPALHGHAADCHDYLTRVPGSFEQTLAGIRNLKAMGQSVITNTVITRSNFRHLKSLVELLADLRVEQYQLAFVHPLGSAGAGEGFEAVVPRMSLLRPHLEAALSWGEQAGLKGMCEAVPLCFLAEDHRHLAAEQIMPSTRILDAEGEIEDYAHYRLTEGKLKGPPCRDCVLEQICEGPWREYPERFGWSEFKKLQK
ncbi:MAG: radical SAM protein [Deltaproteobacteria bacterium]|nr:radical SAM protein [Deltaproteobacteria bacterium]